MRAASSERDRKTGIYVTTDRQRLTQDAAIDEFPTWRPNGARIVFTSTRGAGLGEI